MKRRDFIKKSIPLSTIPLYVSGIPISVMSKSSTMAALTNAGSVSDRCLVLVFLGGGNDGINTLIPIDQYDVLMRDGSGGDSKPLRRPDLMIPENKILKMDGLSDTGLHSRMEKFQTLFNEDKLGIVRNVGYPNPNKSHFRSTDIWNSASSSDEFVFSGWFGRYLSNNHPSYPEGYPNNDFTDPLALTIGNNSSSTCQGPIINMGMSIKNLKSFIEIKEGEGDVPETPYGHELEYIRTASKITNDYFDRLEEAATYGGSSKIEYPDSKLANQLMMVAQLIAGGLKSKIFILKTGGFDTHAKQVDAGNPETGAHPDLMENLAESIHAFQQDIINRNLEERVLTMTYSEFGRRVFQNKSYGTDHGEAAPMFFMSPFVNPNPIGSLPSLEYIDNIEYEYDFRSAYGSVLMDWFGVDEYTIKSLLYDDFKYIPILVGTRTDINEPHPMSKRIVVYPNPFTNKIEIEIEIKSGNTLLKIVDSSGREVKNIVEKSLKGGAHKFKYNSSGLTNGLYFVLLENNRKRHGVSIIKRD
tara:strand:+ start:680 stop:2263 length:1584 start_codon:yes stop_codon:yes gene_type:complete